LAHHVIKAADRGVKVRILLDDIGLAGYDSIIAAMDAHPNIQIRIFNPFALRSLRIFNFIHDFDRLNHRMHNKTFVMDNSVAIIGGRNIGDQYFAVSQESNFRDLDIAAAGPIVREISTVYDYFWNGDWSVPIYALAAKTYTQKELIEVKKKIDQKVATDKFPYILDKDVKALRSRLISIRDNFIWAEGQYVWDDPKVMSVNVDEQKGTMIEKLGMRVNSLQKQLYMESAYFIPRDSGIEALTRLHERGVKIRVLTNSLASNDVIPAHAGYAGYRKKLIKSGVELYELRPDAGGKNITNDQLLTKTSNSGLHTKTMVFDDNAVFVGSFNLDPRSAAINTEGGLYVESPQLAKEVIKYMKDGVEPRNSYRVVLDTEGELTWVTIIDGKKIIYRSEPEVGAWKKFQSFFIGILPVELQL
jgi:putative cardiolipin synthase